MKYPQRGQAPGPVLNPTLYAVGTASCDSRMPPRARPRLSRAITDGETGGPNFSISIGGAEGGGVPRPTQRTSRSNAEASTSLVGTRVPMVGTSHWGARVASAEVPR